MNTEECKEEDLYENPIICLPPALPTAQPGVWGLVDPPGRALDYPVSSIYYSITSENLDGIDAKAVNEHLLDIDRFSV